MKKIILSILASLVFLFSLTPTAYAQSTWYNQAPAEWYQKVYDTNNPSEIFGERYTAAQVDWIIWSVITWLPTKLVGPTITSCGVALVFGGDAGTCVKAIFSASNLQVQPVAQSQESLLAAIFAEERPISAITYFKDLARKFKLIPEAQAQGFGFQYALSPILEMWKASRNVAYSLLILATIILAFMIMFRVKISPQVVISVQSAIPKIAIALILITFSYAIAGFLVDMMYVFIGLVSLVGRSFLPFDISSTAVFNFLTKGQPFNINVQIGAIGLMALYLVLFCLISALTLFSFLGLALSGLGIAIAAIGIGSTIAGSGGTVGVILLFLGLIIITVITIVLLWMVLKTLWMLLKAYAFVLLLAIFAPFQILLGVVAPNFGFGSWLKSFISNLSTFVVTGVLFLLSFSFLSQGFVLAFQDFNNGDIVRKFLLVVGGSGAVNRLGGTASLAWPPLLGFGDKGSVALLFVGASFVIFTLIPKASDIIKSMIEGKPFAYGAAIGEVAAPFRWAAGTPSGRAIQEAMGRQSAAGMLTRLSRVFPEGAPGRSTLEKLAEAAAIRKQQGT